MKSLPVAPRRSFLKAAAAASLASSGGPALAQAIDFRPNARYPEPALQILDPSFLKYRIYSSTIEQVGTGMRWAEGPVYMPAQRRRREVGRQHLVRGARRRLSTAAAWARGG